MQALPRRMTVAMLLDSTHLMEGAATLASLATHASRQRPVDLFIFVDDMLEPAACAGLETSIRDINGGIAFTWVKTTGQHNGEAVDGIFHVLSYFHGKKVLIVNHAVLFLQDIAKIYNFFSTTCTLSGVMDFDAGFRSEAVYLTAGTPYIHESLLWADLRSITVEELTVLREKAKNDTITALLGSGCRDVLNRALRGRIDVVPFNWKSYHEVDNNAAYLINPEGRSKDELALLFCDTRLRYDSTSIKKRFVYIRKISFYCGIKEHSVLKIYDIILNTIKKIKKYAVFTYKIIAKKIISPIQSKIEYSHALTFRYIRDRLLEINAEKRESNTFSFKDHIQYDHVFTLENEDFIYGKYGIKNTYNLLFGIKHISQFENKDIGGKSAIFFHILRNSKIKKQISALLMAIAGKIDFYFVETALITCITNINTSDIPFRFRRNSSYLPDDKGFYYDAMLPTRLESYLNSKASSLSLEERERALGLIRFLTVHKVSKYNYLHLSIPPALLSPSPKVLVVDQSKRDASVTRGMADETTFHDMLETAMRENPDAEILIKTHPDSIHRGRGSYYAHVRSEGRIHKITESVNPYSLLEHVDAVYVCTSNLGLEALLCNKQVHVFGMPVYAGWGLTMDRQKLARRTRMLSLPELVHALYIRFPIYFDPLTGEQVEVERYVESLLTLRNEYYSLYDKASFGLAKEYDNDRKLDRTWQEGPGYRDRSAEWHSGQAQP